MKKIFALISFLVVVSSFVACVERKGPAERAGESIDRATSNAADAIENAGDDIKDSVDRSKK